MTLYEMTAQAQALKALLESEEIDEQAFADTLEAIGADEKVDSYCRIIKSIEGDNALIDAEIARLTALKQRNGKSIDRMKEALDRFMAAIGSTKEKTPFFSVSYRTSESVQVYDLSAIPERYIKMKVEQAPDKTAIKAALKAGEMVKGCSLEKKRNIQIK